MNKYFLILKGNNKHLATEEFETLFNLYFNEKISLKQAQNTIYYFKSKHNIKPNHSLLKRLTFTNYLGLEIQENKNFDDFQKNLPKEIIKQHEGKSFVVQTRKSKRDLKLILEPKELAKPIWNSLKNPQVSIKNPDIEYSFIFYDNPENIHFCIKIYENEKDYLERMPKLRPVVKPYTLKSDMARASINLLNLKKGTILDPFCGIGGILLEAQDLGFQVIGNDINWNDLKSFKKNFDHYFPNANYIRTLADSKNQFLKVNTIDGIVTDVPYGKSSRKLGIDLYEDFLKSAKIYLKKGKRLVVIYANFTDLKPLALKYFNEVTEIQQYINASMTRYILVLENSK